MIGLLDLIEETSDVSSGNCRSDMHVSMGLDADCCNAGVSGEKERVLLHESLGELEVNEVDLEAIG